MGENTRLQKPEVERKINVSGSVLGKVQATPVIPENQYLY